MSIRPFQQHLPTLGERVYVDPAAVVIGDVVIGDDSSIWPGTVIRGDVNFIRIGARTNVQDGTVIHVDSPMGAGDPGRPTLIGDDVLIGHMALIHGCVLADRAFVGLGAIAMDGSAIESDGMLAAGAMLTPGKTIGPRQLWAGRPARPMRELTDEQLAMQQAGVAHYVENGRAHRAAISAAGAP